MKSTLLTHPIPLEATCVGKCPVCGCANLQEFFTATKLPAQIGMLWPTARDARNAPCGDVRLFFCHQCGLAHNQAFDPHLVAYEPGYEFSLHHSPAHRAFLEETADRLIELHDLNGKAIVEVGCGEGFFLKLLCERSGARGFGFDPAAPLEATIQTGSGSVTFIRDYYSPKYADVPCDLLCARSMFDQVAAPLTFLQMLRQTIGDRKPAVYFDLPNAEFVFGQLANWNIFYEQCCYFDLASIEEVFSLAGFDVANKGPCLGDGYYLFVDAIPSTETTSPTNKEKLLELPPPLAAFSQHHRAEIERWAGIMEVFREQQKRVVAWGSGGRCINFLNVVPNAEVVSHVVDINPRRQGRFVSGSGQEVIPPERLQELRPDVIIISNSLYAAEIREQVARLGVRCDFLEL